MVYEVFIKVAKVLVIIDIGLFIIGIGTLFIR